MSIDNEVLSHKLYVLIFLLKSCSTFTILSSSSVFVVCSISYFPIFVVSSLSIPYIIAEPASERFTTILFFVDKYLIIHPPSPLFTVLSHTCKLPSSPMYDVCVDFNTEILIICQFPFSSL